MIADVITLSHMEFQYRVDFYPGDRRHTSRALESKFKDAFPTATIDWKRGQANVDQNLARAKQQNCPQIMQDTIAQQKGDVFFLEIPTTNSDSTLYGYVQHIDGWLGDSIALEMSDYNLNKMIELSFKIADAIDFKFVLRHEEKFYLDTYFEKCDDPNEFVDSRFQFGMNDIELNVSTDTPRGALSNACRNLAPECPLKQGFGLNAQSILDSLTSIGEIRTCWGFDTGTDGFHGALFDQSNWTSIFWPNHHASNA